MLRLLSAASGTIPLAALLAADPAARVGPHQADSAGREKKTKKNITAISTMTLMPSSLSVVYY
jgi:hypothetical protein